MPTSALIAALVFSSLTIPGFDRVLLPMHNGAVHGAAGSVWNVEEVILNQSDSPATFYPYFFKGSWFDAAIGTLGPRQLLQAMEIDQPMGCRGACPPPPHPGAFLYIHRDHRDRFVMYDRVYESALDADNSGVVVPAIHQDAFRRGRTTFPSIPLGTNFRSTLRAYNTGATPVTLTIRVVRKTAANDTVLATSVSTIPPAYANVASGPYTVPLRPGYQQITIDSLVSEPDTGAVDVIIDSSDETAEYWAFLSLTSYSAQRVTIFTPAP